MENFEESLRKLIANKIASVKYPLEPNPRESLEMLLEHICEKVLAPAHRILIAQKAFSESTLNIDDFFGDSIDDGMDDRKMINLTVIRNEQPLFEYHLSFDGDTENSESRIWRQVKFCSHPMTMDQIPEGFFDFEAGESDWQENMPGRTVLSKDVVNLVGIGEEHFSLDMVEAVAFVQDDFYWVCKNLL